MGSDNESKTEDSPPGLLLLQTPGTCSDCVVPMWASALAPSLQALLSSAPLRTPPCLFSAQLGRPSQHSPWEVARACFQHHLEDRTGQALPSTHTHTHTHVHTPMLSLVPAGHIGWVKWGRGGRSGGQAQSQSLVPYFLNRGSVESAMPSNYSSTLILPGSTIVITPFYR